MDNREFMRKATGLLRDAVRAEITASQAVTHDQCAPAIEAADKAWIAFDTWVWSNEGRA
jgi:hypothetical protein